MPRLESADITVEVVSTSTASPPLQVSFEDALASSRRLWLRGRVHGPLDRLLAPGDVVAERGRRWWTPWRTSTPSLPPPLTQLRLATGGKVLETEVPLGADGQLEALIPVELPLTQRGWRAATCEVRCGGLQAEASHLILTPPADMAEAVAVLLPLEFTFAQGAVQRLVQSEFAFRLASFLRDLDQEAPGRRSIFYLACAPPGENHQAELALAGASLGWPTGTFVLLPGAGEEPAASLVTGLDRLRWLFAAVGDLVVLNAEPTLARSLGDRLKPNPERAEVRRLIHWEALEKEREKEEGVRTAEPNALQPSPGILFAWTRSRAAARPTRSGLLPRSPVVFCHGMLAFSMLKLRMPDDRNCFAPLRKFLRERGCHVLYPQVSPTGGVAGRAEELREQIRRWTDEPVNVIAHSMGGLDARYMITHLGMAHRVRSLTTVSTPHRGTHLADWFLENFRRRVPLLLALEALGVNVDGFQDCRPAACQEFNANTPNRPEVSYFSFGGDVSPARLSPFLRRAWNILTPVEGPNDGMVATASAHWGKHLGNLAADHFAQTPDGVFARPGEDFDALGFYSRLIEDLARRGF